MVKWLAPALTGDTMSVGLRKILCAVRSINFTHYPDMGHTTTVCGPVKSRVPHLKGQSAIAN